MESQTKDITPSGTANSQISRSGIATTTLPHQTTQTGVSVDNAPNATPRQWYAIRATHGRSRSVYDSLMALNDDDIEPYLPVVRKKTLQTDDFNNPHDIISEEPLDKTLVFVRCTDEQFKTLLKKDIKGLTPFYDHFRQNSIGRNPYLVVPDRQMDSFRKVIESEWDDIIIKPSDFTLNEGDMVDIIDGLFKGVRGTVLRYKHQRRVFVRLDGIGVFGTGYIHRNFLRKVTDELQ